MAKPYKRKDSQFWWIAPVINNVQVRQSSGERDYDRALRKLKILEGKLAANAPISARTDRDSFALLLELVRTDYKLRRLRSLYSLEKRLDTALIPALGHLPVAKAWLELENYILERQNGEYPVKNGTINRELAIVRRAYRLGFPKGLVSYIPKISMLPEESERDGFYSPAQFASMVTNTTPLMKNILTVAYVTGWRLNSILKLEWRNVDLVGGFVWLNALETKNRKATRWPLVMGLREVFEEQLAAKQALKDAIVPYVFHRKGKPVKSIRRAFLKTLDAANVRHLFHDFRGTAIINLLESGVETATVMNMVGLKSERMVILYSKKRGMRDDRLQEVGKILEMRMKGKSGESITENVINRP